MERTFEAVEGIFDAMKKRRLLGQTAFGLVAYRDNVSPNPQIEYVTKVVQSLDATLAPEAVVAAIRETRPASVSTKGWDEDALCRFGDCHPF